ncbi:hypothetical protein D3C87_1849250 [compost metagenome]
MVGLPRVFQWEKLPSVLRTARLLKVTVSDHPPPMKPRVLAVDAVAALPMPFHFR